MSVLAATVDPDGRTVELTAERWAHVLDIHPEIAGCQAEILETVRAPERRQQGREANEWWSYRAGVGPSRWLKVVVAYEQERGWIVTAFARRSTP